MSRAPFVPDAGDLVWLEFDPQVGHEQAGRRHAIVVSAASYNAKTGLMLCCPLTTRVKGYPFEVPVAGARASVALADQIKNLDWRARRAAPMGRATPAELAEVRLRLRTLIG